MAVEVPAGFRSGGLAPTGARIVLIRHGEADCNVLGRVGGPLGCTGLSERGRQQAERLRERLEHSREFDDAVALYTSTLPRAIETMAILAPGLPTITPVADCALCEMHPGAADGLTWEEMIATFGGVDWDEDPTLPFSPGGESWSGMFERVRDALWKVAQAHPGQRVIVATHGGVIEQAMKLAMGSAAGERLQLRTEHCSMSELEFERGEVRLLRYNDRAPDVAVR